MSFLILTDFNIVRKSNYTQTLACPNCMELCNTYWHQKAGTHSAEIRNHVLKSFLYLWPGYLRGFSSVSKDSILAQPHSLPWCIIFISVYSCLKRCPSLLDITDIQVFPRNFRSFSLFTATCENCPSAGCVSAANRACKNVDIFRKPFTSLKQILHKSVNFISIHIWYFFRV